MVTSMTGYGRAERSDGKCRITVEIKSVNNRYLDLNLRMPKLCNPFEAEIRALLKRYMQRGKVDVSITYERISSADLSILFHKEVAEEYRKAILVMAREMNLPGEVSAYQLIQLPEVVEQTEKQLDGQEVLSLLKSTLNEAGDAFQKTRMQEGAFLKRDLLDKLNEMEENLSFIAAHSPQVVSEYENRLKERIHALMEDKQIDENRLLMEVAIFADKSCVDEELVRLKSHMQTLRKTLEKTESGNGIGKKMDFIVQEMNREANTILSKTSDIAISERTVELKSEIEKVREQIQNLE